MEKVQTEVRTSTVRQQGLKGLWSTHPEQKKEILPLLGLQAKIKRGEKILAQKNMAAFFQIGRTLQTCRVKKVRSRVFIFDVFLRFTFVLGPVLWHSRLGNPCDASIPCERFFESWLLHF